MPVETIAVDTGPNFSDVCNPHIIIRQEMNSLRLLVSKDWQLMLVYLEYGLDIR